MWWPPSRESKGVWPRDVVAAERRAEAPCAVRGWPVPWPPALWHRGISSSDSVTCRDSNGHGAELVPVHLYRISMHGAQTCSRGTPTTLQEMHNLGPCHFNLLKQVCWGRGLDMGDTSPGDSRQPKSEVPAPGERDPRSSSLSVHPQRSLFSPRP